VTDDDDVGRGMVSMSLRRKRVEKGYPSMLNDVIIKVIMVAPSQT
jgi:hypothetical protein